MLSTASTAIEKDDRHLLIRFFFPFTLFISASLLFIMQPIAAKVLLPIFGGTPSVWTVCMLFFQSMLLLGYVYAWGLSRIKYRYAWQIIHILLCLTSLFLFPLHLSPVLSATDPALLILKTLFIQLGLPILIVSSSAPLLQYAFSRTMAKNAPDPYYLYAASNFGSLLALLSYPFFIERMIGITQQFQLWNTIYIDYIVIIIALMATVRYRSPALSHKTREQLNLKSKAAWISLSFVPCSLMLGVTFYISTDVAATPLFWVIPLALYLLSFIVTFATKPWISHAWILRNTPIAFVFLIISFMFGIDRIHAWPLIFIHLSCFFMIALLCHGNLISKRPSTEHLTTFYLCLATGGLLAGLFNGLLAPRLFSHAYEYPLVVLLATLCLPSRSPLPLVREGLVVRTGCITKPPSSPTLLPHAGEGSEQFNRLHAFWTPLVVLGLLSLSLVTRHVVWLKTVQQLHLIEVLALALIMVRPGNVRCQFLSLGMLFSFIFLPWFSPVNTIEQQRNFYGIKRVFSQNNAHFLMSQSTLHGFQVQSGPDKTNGTISYYGPVLPIVRTLQTHHHPLHATIMGLGAGTLFCQFNAADEVNLIEIDEQVIQIASNPRLFTNLRDCKANAHIIHQDARLALKTLPNKTNDLLVMDAFSSDAIPVHLLTQEAFALYQKKLSPSGAILINITNRHLNVLPVITGAAHRFNLIMLYHYASGNTLLGQFPSQWILLTPNEELANEVMQLPKWHFVTNLASVHWTDDYSNIIPLLTIRR